MKPSSAKAKGRKLQQMVRDKLLETFPELNQDDVRSTSMGASGEDVLLSQQAKKLIPYDIECKNVEKLNVWKALDQLEKRVDKNLNGLLVFKRNRSKVYACIELNHLLELLKCQKS